jgi:hypothetical protein
VVTDTMGYNESEVKSLEKWLMRLQIGTPAYFACDVSGRW